MTGPVRPAARRTVSGHYAGAVSRAAAAALDIAIIVTTYTFGYAGLNLLTTALFQQELSGSRSGPLAIAGLVVWGFAYLFLSLAVTGRTVGKGVVGLTVVNADGSPLGVRRAFVRTLLLPVSTFLFGAGLVLIVVHREHRSLHDLIAHTAVVYDWGDRSAELPGPLAEFLSRNKAV